MAASAGADGFGYDVLYINGESALPGSDVLAIEPEFRRLMFC